MVAVVVAAPSFGAAMAFFVAPGVVGNFAYGAGKTLLYGLPIACAVLARDRSPVAWPTRANAIPVGLALGLGMAALAWGVFLAGESSIDAAGLAHALRAAGLDTPGRYLLVGAYLCTVNAFLEEVTFRWFLVTRFGLVLRPALAAVAASLAFTTHHVIVLRAFFDWPLALGCAAGVLAGGLCWSWLYLRFRSLWPGFVSHALVDVAILTLGWKLLQGGAAG